MRRTFLKTGIIVVCMVLTMGLLSACSASNPVGTWYKGDQGSFYNIDEGGDIYFYNSERDELFQGNWVENNGSCEVTGFGSEPWIFEWKNKNTLYCEEFNFILERGTERDIPAITTKELTDYAWVTADERYELFVYDGGDWELYDYDEGEDIEEGTYIIEDGNLSMENTDGVQYEATIGENRDEITVFDNMVFIKEE